MDAEKAKPLYKYKEKGERLAISQDRVPSFRAGAGSAKTWPGKGQQPQKDRSLANVTKALSSRGLYCDNLTRDETSELTECS